MFPWTIVYLQSVLDLYGICFQVQNTLQPYYTVLSKVLLVERLGMAILCQTGDMSTFIKHLEKNVSNSIIEFIIIVT